MQKLQKICLLLMSLTDISSYAAESRIRELDDQLFANKSLATLLIAGGFFLHVSYLVINSASPTKTDALSITLKNLNSFAGISYALALAPVYKGVYLQNELSKLEQQRQDRHIQLRLSIQRDWQNNLKSRCPILCNPIHRGQ